MSEYDLTYEQALKHMQENEGVNTAICSYLERYIIFSIGSEFYKISNGDIGTAYIESEKFKENMWKKSTDVDSAIKSEILGLEANILQLHAKSKEVEQYRILNKFKEGQ